MAIDPEGESQALAQRSAEIAEALQSLIVEVDRSGIREAQAEAARLGSLAHEAKARVAEALRRGKPLPLGTSLGAVPPIRRVPRAGRDLAVYDTTAGRSVISSELVELWRYRRDVLGPAITAAYEQAARSLAQVPAVEAAARQHLNTLRIRQNFVAEGGPAVEAALAAHQAQRGRMAEGLSEGQAVSVEAENRLAALGAERATAALEGRGVPSHDAWIAAKTAGYLGTELLDVSNPLGAPAGPAPTPVAGRQPSPRRSASDELRVRSVVRATLAEGAPVPEEYSAPEGGPVLTRGGGAILGIR